MISQKVQVGLILVVFCTTCFATTYGLLSTQVTEDKSRGVVLGTTCITDGKYCRSDNDCCSGKCDVNNDIPWYLRYRNIGTCAKTAPTPSPVPRATTTPPPSSNLDCSRVSAIKEQAAKLLEELEAFEQSCQEKPTPSVTRAPTPTPKAKCGVNSFQVVTSCDEEVNGYFRGFQAVCYDGTSLTGGDSTSCKDSNTWRTEAERLCQNHCSN